MIPLAADVKKDWHRLISDELRIHLLKKLVIGVLPELMNSDTPLPDNDKLGPAMESARSEEKKMFELAESRAEYYGMIAEKIYQCQEGRETPPAPPLYQHPKAWQSSVTEGLRQHVINKIKNSLNSYRDEGAPLHVAKKAEGNCYETAGTRYEYYHLAAKKIFHMQRAMEAFKLRKQSETTSTQSPQTDEMEAELMEVAMNVTD